MSNLNKDLPQFFPVTRPDAWKVFSLQKKPVSTCHTMALLPLSAVLMPRKSEVRASVCTWTSHTLGPCLDLCASKDQKHCGVGIGFSPKDISSNCFLPNKWNLDHRISALICIDSRTDLLGCYFSLMVIWSKWITASILAVYFLLVDRGQIAWFYLYLYGIQIIFFLLYRLFKSN